MSRPLPNAILTVLFIDYIPMIKHIAALLTGVSILLPAFALAEGLGQRDGDPANVIAELQKQIQELQARIQELRNLPATIPVAPPAPRWGEDAERGLMHAFGTSTPDWKHLEDEWRMASSTGVMNAIQRIKAAIQNDATTPPAGLFNALARHECIEFKQGVRRGTDGDHVNNLQQFLASLPGIYPEGIASGHFGALTERAVRMFQQKFGIEQTGNVGPKTRLKIWEITCGNVTSTPVI